MLDAPCCDLDARVEAGAGRSISSIFATDGEAAFRMLEQRAMAVALNQPPQVIAAGAGWAAEPGNLAAAELRALIIYMSTDPVDAAHRLRGDQSRPLLGGTDLEQRLGELLTRRESWYRLAALEVAVGRSTPELAAAAVVTAARQYGGW